MVGPASLQHRLQYVCMRTRLLTAALCAGAGGGGAASAGPGRAAKGGAGGGGERRGGGAAHPAGDPAGRRHAALPLLRQWRRDVAARAAGTGGGICGRQRPELGAVAQVFAIHTLRQRAAQRVNALCQCDGRSWMQLCCCSTAANSSPVCIEAGTPTAPQNCLLEDLPSICERGKSQAQPLDGHMTSPPICYFSLLQGLRDAAGAAGPHRGHWAGRGCLRPAAFAAAGAGGPAGGHRRARRRGRTRRAAGARGRGGQLLICFSWKPFQNSEICWRPLMRWATRRSAMRCKPSLTRWAAHLSISKLEASWRTSWRPLMGVHQRARQRGRARRLTGTTTLLSTSNNRGPRGQRKQLLIYCR